MNTDGNNISYPRLHIVGGNYHNSSEAAVFTDRGHFHLVNEPYNADILVLTGGVDLDPQLYGEVALPQCYGVSPRRDKLEWDAVIAAPNAIKFGICRGGQLLNIMAGGTLWQHVNNHNYGVHRIRVPAPGTEFGWSYLKTSSVHHQQMRVTTEAELIAYCHVSTRKESQTDFWKFHTVQDTIETNVIDEPVDPKIDVEVCWYKDLKYLCIQGHPEYESMNPEFTNWCYNLCMEKLNEQAA